VIVVHKIDRFSRKLRLTLEWFEKLGKAGIGFVSIENQIDYTTPAGKFMLVMQGGLAELYSDNLGQEVRKGWAERRAQGITADSCRSVQRRALTAYRSQTRRRPRDF
jgi:DNA invertase Pin-like site-specific DNA recombinase